VSFQSRDYTGKNDMRYLACPMKIEQVHHKHILYRKKGAHNEVGICVEGITDVWRFVDNAFATFGIAYTPAQVRVISKLYKRVVTLFDPEPQAQSQAIKLGAELTFRGVEVENISLATDPAEMSQADADYLKKQLKIISRG
jgi:DNA primase